MKNFFRHPVIGIDRILSSGIKWQLLFLLGVIVAAILLFIVIEWLTGSILTIKENDPRNIFVDVYYHFADPASHRTHWDGTHYPAVSEFGGEIGKWASLLTNEKHQLQHKLNLNYLVNENHSVNFNSLLKYAHANPRDGMKDKVIGYRTDFPSNMFSWVAGLNYDYRTSNDKFLNSFNVKYYYYSMKTRMASVLVKTAEDIDTHKNDFGISNALRYRITPSLMAKASFGYDVRLPSEEELLGDGYVIAPAGNLTPERNISVNIGMLFDLTGKASSNLQIELNGYYMHLKDMIRFTGGFLQSQYQNFGEMRTLGMEAEVKADTVALWLCERHLPRSARCA